MAPNQNEVILEEIKPLLQLKRPLLSIDKYAAREGVTRRVVEEYGRLGVIQIRRYKGKTYVVDVPLSPYNPALEELQMLQENSRIASSNTEKRSQPVNRTGQVRMISELTPPNPPNPPRPVQKTIRDSQKIAARPTKPKIETTRVETNLGLAKNLLCKASKFSNKLVGKNQHEFTHSRPVSAPAPNRQDERRQFYNETKQARPQRIKQIAAVSLIVCLFIAFITCLWLYMNQNVYRGRLDQTSANIQNVYDDVVRTNQHLATLQGKLVEYTAEIEWIKNELKNSKAESESMRNDLDGFKRSLDTIQQYNNAALGQLREQLQQITTQLGKVIKNTETSLGSGK
jgi:hypothetical protein